MKNILFCLCSFIVLTSTLKAQVPSVVEENLYYEFQKSILEPKSTTKSIYGFTPFEQKIYVDALWTLVEEGSPEALKALDSIPTFNYSVIEKLRLGILRIKYGRSMQLPTDVIEEVENNLKSPQSDVRIIYTLAAYEDELLETGHLNLLTLAKTHKEFFDLGQDQEMKKEYSDDMIADLFHRTPDVTTYMNGEYVKSVKIYMFCRNNRIFPCLMTMRNIHGEVLRNDDGTIWTHYALASSARGLPSYTTNGNTPAGVWTIDSVMPVPDQQVSFGKFRRMMLNMIPKSKKEELLLSLIPESSHKSDWWKPSTVARDIGRSLFRIHGSGKKNNDPKTPYYPFMRTSGCIAQRENIYDGIEFKDQRILLDTIMKAMDLQPTYENELKVKGILFLVELDDETAPVTIDDLIKKGIE